MANGFIPSMKDWRALPSKEDRKTILGKLREQVGDRAILDTWGITPNSYYATLISYGFPTKGVMESLGENHPHPKGKKEKSEPPKEKRKYTKKAPETEKVQGVPSDRNWPRNNVVELEHKVIPDPTTTTMTWRVNNERPLQLPFPALRGTPSQLLKQFEALVLFLSALDEESIRYEVYISATKQSGA